MATSKTALLANRRAEITNQLREIVLGWGEDAQLVKNNAFMYPTLDADGNELFAVVTVTIPRGEQGGPAYDGYAAAEAYRFDLEQNRIRKEKQAEEKKAAAEKRKQKREERKKKKETEG